MRKHLIIAFLGLWIALVPFLPIQCGSTQTSILLVSGLLVALLAFHTFRTTPLS